jgi:hypothetical protein
VVAPPRRGEQTADGVAVDGARTGGSVRPAMPAATAVPGRAAPPRAASGLAGVPRPVAGCGRRSGGPLAGGYRWALGYDEVRAEKVRAAFTREEPAIRDFYDLRLLADAGADMSSDGFVALTDQKLAEESARPLAEQPSGVALTAAKRRHLDTAGRRQLAAVVRVDEPAFDLGGTIAYYDALWVRAADRSEARHTSEGTKPNRRAVTGCRGG